ncbi:MAG: HD domain-containing phosphohydrolase [Pseudomonadota bacterium]
MADLPASDIEVKVGVENLRIGMYVSRLDRPWAGSGFTVQGLWLETPRDLERIRERCSYVFVDTKQSTRNVPREAIILNSDDEPEEELSDISGKVRIHSRRQLDEWVRGRTADKRQRMALVKHRDQVAVTKELSSARVAVADLEASVAFAVESIHESEPVNFRAISSAAQEVAKSVVRNPDAAIGLAMGRKQEPYTLRHCVNMAIWAMALGRQIGLPEGDLTLLGLGATLCDLGREKLPTELLERPGRLSHWELGVIREHVAFSLELLESDQELDSAVLAMVAQHHEHLDGSGYPQSLKGRRIDLYARIARVADCFEAMITAGPHREPLSVSRAVKELYALRDTHFQRGLVESFIAAIGIYPAGTSVRLSSKECGVVISGARDQHLKPVVWRMLDSDGLAFGRPGALDLSEDPKERQIVKDFPDGELGISARSFFC